jgi:hypothetical protein
MRFSYVLTPKISWMRNSRYVGTTSAETLTSTLGIHTGVTTLITY